MHRNQLHMFLPLPLSLAALVAWPSSARADQVIDAFNDPLPVQQLPEGSNYPGLWAGTFMPGFEQAEDQASQAGLGGVLGGQRDTSLTAVMDQSLLFASIYGGALSYATASSTSGVLTLEYGGYDELDANLVRHGELGFELEINGDLDDGFAPRPVALTVTVVSGSGAAYDEVEIELLDDGVYQIPFASFAGVDFSDVDYLSFVFDGSAHAAIDFELLGGLRTTGCLQGPAALADIAIDNFETALPMTPLPGYDVIPGLWAGTFGGASQSLSSANQQGIAGALGGQRVTTLRTSDISNFLTAIIGNDDATPSLWLSTGYPTSGYLNFRYPMAQPVDLGAMQAFEFEIDGDMDDGGAPRPISARVTVVSNTGIKSKTIEVLDDGIYTIPFSDFPGVNWSAVSEVRMMLDASKVQAIDYALVGGWRATACVP